MEAARQVAPLVAPGDAPPLAVRSSTCVPPQGPSLVLMDGGEVHYCAGANLDLYPHRRSCVDVAADGEVRGPRAPEPAWLVLAPHTQFVLHQTSHGVKVCRGRSCVAIRPELSAGEELRTAYLDWPEPTRRVVTTVGRWEPTTPVTINVWDATTARRLARTTVANAGSAWAVPFGPSLVVLSAKADWHMLHAQTYRVDHGELRPIPLFLDRLYGPPIALTRHRGVAVEEPEQLDIVDLDAGTIEKRIDLAWLLDAPYGRWDVSVLSDRHGLALFVTEGVMPGKSAMRIGFIDIPTGAHQRVDVPVCSR